MSSNVYICENCGKKFSIDEKSNFKSKRFCSSFCSHSFSSSFLKEKDKSSFKEDRICKKCGKTFSISKTIKQEKFYYCEECREEMVENSRYISPRLCKACGKEFNYDWRLDPKTRKNTDPKYCSYSCSHSRSKTEEQKKNLSITLKNSSKAKLANLKQKEIRKTEEWIKSHRKAIYETRICPVCGKKFETSLSRNKKYCSRECWDKVSGGFREGSVTNHIHGNYEGYRYDSSWEYIWIRWALVNKIKFVRNNKGFPYIYKGENHLYYPDFYLPDKDEYVEIKGIVDELWEAKKSSFPHRLKVYTKSEIKSLKLNLESLGIDLSIQSNKN